MIYVLDIVRTVYGYLRADWLVLLIGMVMAVSINVYVDPEKMKVLLKSKAGLSIPGSVAFGALTPLCACGTMAVLISMFVAAMPWGAVMAFLISSPLTSPDEFMFETAFFGSRFAFAMLISSIVLGLSAGFLAHFLETRTNFFKDQLRIAQESACCGTSDDLAEAECCATAASSQSCGCPAEEISATSSCGCGSIVQKAPSLSSMVKKLKLDEFAHQFVAIGLKKILLYFVLFIAVGRVVELMIPKAWIQALLSSDKAYSIPLSATIGLPLYVSGSSALPLLKAFMNSGAGQGAILALLITGKATGVPVMIGMSTFLKPRALAFYVGFIYLGGMICGYIYQYLLALAW